MYLLMFYLPSMMPLPYTRIPDNTLISMVVVEMHISSINNAGEVHKVQDIAVSGTPNHPYHNWSNLG